MTAASAPMVSFRRLVTKHENMQMTTQRPCLVTYCHNNVHACYDVFCGLRQGGVLSPILFNSQLGCQFLGMNIGCIMYADDILLLSASVDGLQHLLDVCGDYAQKHQLVFNCDKSV